METTSDSRYSRQTRFSPLGEIGQARMQQSRALLCGCGALGTVIAERLVRAGVGRLRIVDRDWVELSNLQRQSLFTEDDAAQSRPKAIAAQNALAQINSTIQIEPFVEDVTFQNIGQLATGCDLIVDGTDNFETRFLINDYCVKHGLPWIHGGCLGSGGQVMSIIPGVTACFRCLVPQLPPRDVLETCDTAGVLGPAVALIASWQAAEAMKVLSGNTQAVCRQLIVLDSWNTECRLVTLHRNTKCPTCGQGEFPFLSGEIRSESTILCGKNAVQIDPPIPVHESPAQLADRLQELGTTQFNSFFVRIELPAHRLTIFKGGRTIVEGTTSPAEARSLVARILGG